MLARDERGYALFVIADGVLLLPLSARLRAEPLEDTASRALREQTMLTATEVESRGTVGPVGVEQLHIALFEAVSYDGEVRALDGQETGWHSRISALTPPAHLSPLVDAIFNEIFEPRPR